MADEPTGVNYPTSYEDDSTLLSPLLDRLVGTVKYSIGVDTIQVTFEEELTSLGDPCFLVFEGGEIWYVQEGGVFIDAANNDTVITLESKSQRGYHASPIQPHNALEEAYFTMVSTHHVQFKDAVEALQKNAFLLGTDAERTAYTPEVAEGWLTTDTGNIYFCFSAGVWIRVDHISHAELAGRGDDDHTQYHTDGRADTWHAGLSGSHIAGGDNHSHVPLDNSEGLPVVRVYGGLLANLGSPSYEGQIYFATDTDEDGTLYISSDGVNWLKISGAPSGAIGMFDGACPTGWTRYSALDEKFALPAIEAESGQTGGAETHSHTYSQFVEHYHTDPELSGIGTNSGGNHTHSVGTERTGSGGNPLADHFSSSLSHTTGSTGNHSHTVTILEADTDVAGVASPSTSSDNHLPPYRDVVWCKKN